MSERVLSIRPPAAHRKLYTISEGRYVLDADDVATMLDVSRVRRDRNGELRGNLVVKCVVSGAKTLEDDTLLIFDNLNLSSPRARAEAAAALGQRAQTGHGLNWRELVDELALRVQRAEQRGQPAVLLADVPRPAPDQAYDVAGLPLLKRHPTIWFGDGGSLKSYLALHAAGELARQGVRVGLFDWELAGEDHRERLEALYGPLMMPSIVYVRCLRPLVYELDRLAEIRHQHALEFIVCDSVAFGCSGPPEDALVAAEYFRAIRTLDVGALLIAHISKSDGADQRPFGSAFWHNGARATWFVKLAEAQPDTTVQTVALLNRKNNTGSLRGAVGLQVTFDGTSTRITRTDLATHDSLAVELPLWQRIRHSLSGGALTLTELAEDLDAKLNSVEKAVKRRSGTFTLVTGVDGIQRVGLTTRRAS